MTGREGICHSFSELATMTIRYDTVRVDLINVGTESYASATDTWLRVAIVAE